jgi:hypothetical protein
VLNHSLSSAAKDKEVGVSLDADDHGVTIFFSGISADNVDEFPTQEEEGLSKVLSAELSFDAFSGQFTIKLPPRIRQSPVLNLYSSQ